MNLKVSRKLLIGFMTIVALAAAIGVVSYLGLAQVGNAASIQDGANQIKSNILDARRHEKNYIIRGDTSEIGNVLNLTQTIKDEAKTIATKTSDAAVLRVLDSITEETGTYETAFNNYVTFTGQEATADNAMVQAARTMLQEAQQENDSAIVTNILEARIAEKNYIIRGNASYINEVHGNITSVIAGINSSDIVTAANAYKAAFDSYVTLEGEKTNADNSMTQAGRMVIGNQDPTNTYYGGAELLRANTNAEMNSLQASTNMMIVAFMAVACGIGVTLAYLVTRSITKPLNSLVADTKVIAEGNLGHKIQVKEGKDEIGSVVSAVKNMVHNTAELVRKVKTATETVSSMSQQVSATAQEVNAGMEQVATATQQVSQGSQKLSQLSQEAAEHTRTLSTTLQQTGVNTDKSVEVGKKSVEIMQHIQTESEKAMKSIEQIQASMGTTAQTVNGMHEALGKIGELANLVTDVASQTEMLALNAAIEAARAGEAGRGFAVVADAVKELSEQSSQASSETLQSVTQVQTRGKEALEVANKSSSQANGGAQVIKTTIDGTKTVANSIQEINQLLTEITQGVKKGIEAVQGVVKVVDEVSGVSQESASACEENSAAMEEQTASMSQLATSAAKLSEVATQLQKELDKFKT